ncbi:MAG: isoaspartyl peptidase/L-asparaginase family protein [Gemmataceae bacterium]
MLPSRAEPDNTATNIVLAIHGGAGVIERDKMTPEREKAYRETLEKALRAGHAALDKKGGTSLDAVEAAIRVLEDSPLFNAGKGAVFTHEGHNELDASIMAGKSKNGGAVAGVQCLKNPISAARLVMEKSPHVLLTGRGAVRFAAEHDLEAVDPSYFYTLERWQQLQERLKRDKKGAKAGTFRDYFGTVGAVALDGQGNLAAGTSTGGMTNKRFNRVGDSPIIGAGTYADNEACAVSGTGHGEVFIRFAVAHDVAARMKYQQKSVSEAARAAIAQLPEEPGGVGGVIALDARGNYAAAFNTDGMYRGTITRDGKIHIAIYDK